MTIVRRGAGPLNSKAVEYGAMVFVSGILAPDLTASAEGQMEQVLSDIDKHLAAAGSNKSRLLQVQIWLSDMRHKDRINAVWTKWIDLESKPARVLVEAKLAVPEALVEVMVIGAK